MPTTSSTVQNSNIFQKRRGVTTYGKDLQDDAGNRYYQYRDWKCDHYGGTDNGNSGHCQRSASFKTEIRDNFLTKEAVSSSLRGGAVNALRKSAADCFCSILFCSTINRRRYYGKTDKSTSDSLLDPVFRVSGGADLVYVLFRRIRAFRSHRIRL